MVIHLVMTTDIHLIVECLQNLRFLYQQHIFNSESGFTTWAHLIFELEGDDILIAILQ